MLIKFSAKSSETYLLYFLFVSSLIRFIFIVYYYNCYFFCHHQPLSLGSLLAKKITHNYNFLYELITTIHPLLQKDATSHTMFFMNFPINILTSGRILLVFQTFTYKVQLQGECIGKYHDSEFYIFSLTATTILG